MRQSITGNAAHHSAEPLRIEILQWEDRRNLQSVLFVRNSVIRVSHAVCERERRRHAPVICEVRLEFIGSEMTYGCSSDRQRFAVAGIAIRHRTCGDHSKEITERP